MSRWANLYLPAIFALLAARLLYVVVPTGSTPTALVVFIVVIAALPVLFYLACHLVGFLYGLFGFQPFERTRAFDTGWDAARRLTGR